MNTVCVYTGSVYTWSTHASAVLAPPLSVLVTARLQLVPLYSRSKLFTLMRPNSGNAPVFSEAEVIFEPERVMATVAAWVACLIDALPDQFPPL